MSGATMRQRRGWRARGRDRGRSWRDKQLDAKRGDLTADLGIRSLTWFARWSSSASNRRTHHGGFWGRLAHASNASSRADALENVRRGVDELCAEFGVTDPAKRNYLCAFFEQKYLTKAEPMIQAAIDRLELRLRGNSRCTEGPTCAPGGTRGRSSAVGTSSTCAMSTEPGSTSTCTSGRRAALSRCSQVKLCDVDIRKQRERLLHERAQKTLDLLRILHDWLPVRHFHLLETGLIRAFRMTHSEAEPTRDLQPVCGLISISDRLRDPVTAMHFDAFC